LLACLQSVKPFEKLRATDKDTIHTPVVVCSTGRLLLTELFVMAKFFKCLTCKMALQCMLAMTVQWSTKSSSIFLMKPGRQ